VWDRDGGGGSRADSGSSGYIQLWDAESGQPVRRFQGHTGRVWSVAFSPDGRRALSGAADKTVRLWDGATGQELHRFDGHEGDVRSGVFLPDGHRALSASHDHTLRLWQLPR